MRLASTLAELRATWLRHGLAAVVRRVKSYRHEGEGRLLLFLLSRPRSLPEAPGVSFRFVTAEEAARIPEVLPEGLEVQRVDDRCLLQYQDGRLVGYTWVSLFPVAFLARGVHISLSDDTAYAYKTFTFPDYRGSTLQALRAVELLRRLEPLGKRRTLCYVDHLNFASLKGVRKSGYEPVGEVRFRRERGEVRVSLRLPGELWSETRRW